LVNIKKSFFLINHVPEYIEIRHGTLFGQGYSSMFKLSHWTGVINANIVIKAHPWSWDCVPKFDTTQSNFNQSIILSNQSYTEL